MSPPRTPVADLMAAAEPAAHRNLERALNRAGPQVAQLQTQLRQVFRAGVPVERRVIQIRHLAGTWSALMGPDAACRAGCSHCCHINTDVPQVEAELISKKTGRPLKRPAVREIGAQVPPEQYFGVPCPFLVRDACSIYEHRPLACRTLVSLADDAQLCELREGEAVPVPYANATLWQGAFATATEKEVWADIREWFDPQAEPEQP